MGLCAAAFAAALTGAAPAQAHETGKAAHWELKDSGTDARFRGLSAVSRDTAWVAGSKGTVLRTTDGGASWRDVSPPGAAELEFRDIEAFDARRAVALTIGEGEASRVFRTEDGGATWTESFRNTDPKAFYDCLTFFDRRHGLAMSDPVDGRFRILSTSDGGRSWKVLPGAGMPVAQEGEAGFAASGQCLVSAGPRDVWLATGGAARARVLHSADRGLTWKAADTPIPAGDPARGVFALAFRDRAHGYAVGGDYRADQTSPGRRPSAATAAAPGPRPAGRRPPTAPAWPGSRTAVPPPSRSARPAPTSRPTAAVPGGPWTPVRTTPWTALPTWVAGPPVRRAGWHVWSADPAPGRAPERRLPAPGRRRARPGPARPPDGPVGSSAP